MPNSSEACSAALPGTASALAAWNASLWGYRRSSPASSVVHTGSVRNTAVGYAGVVMALAVFAYAGLIRRQSSRHTRAGAAAQACAAAC
ncbi:MAG: hypothetical protein M3O28_02505 [Actinomycetota bacterium]|nr:hypothetical protein [Actinomycetota bacterium]